jgi:DNA-binding NarL/FixJ family response regulator
MEKIKIIIAEDHPLMRSAICNNLTNESDRIEVIGQCCDGIELLEILKYQQPDIIILDIEMPRMDGIETLKAIREKYQDTIKVLVFSANLSNYINLRLMQMGADGILFKKSSAEELIEAINIVYKESVFFQDSLAFKMLSNNHNMKKVSLEQFNSIDFEILQLMCQQKNAHEIADELKMSVNTINKYRSKLMEKTESQNLAGMVIFAIQNGIYVIPNSNVPQKQLYQIND